MKDESKTKKQLLEELAGMQRRILSLEKSNKKHKNDKNTLKRAVESLRESEIFHRGILDNILDVYYRTDENGNLIMMSPSGASLLGYESVQEMIGLNVADAFYADPNERNMILSKLRKEGFVRDFEVTVKHRNGTSIPVSTSSRYYYKDNGEIQGVEGIFRDIRERKKVERAFVDSEHRLKELFENMSSSVAVYEAVADGEDFIFKDFNRAAEMSDQIDKKDVIGKSVLEVFPEVRGFGLFDVFQRVWRTGKPEHHPVSLYKDNRIFGWKENYVYKLPSEEIVAIYDDVTENKRAEEALLQSETRYRQLIESSNDWVWEVNQEGVYTYASPHVQKVLGYTPEEVIGKTPFDLMPEDEAERVRQIFSSIVAQRQPFRGLENLNRRKDGRLVILETNGLPVIDDQGFFLGYRGMDRDITDRKRVEEALLESEERFRTLIELTPDLIYRVDRKGLFTYVNPMLEKVTGYTASELKRQPYTAIIAPEFRESVIEHFKRGIKGEKIPPYESEIVSKDGTRIPVEFQASSLHDKDGKPIGRFGIGRDITERKRLEENLITSEKKYRNLADNTLVGVYQTNLAGSILYASQAFADMFGYDSPQELKSINVISLYKNKEDRKKFVETIKKDRKLLNYDLKLVTKDGKDKDIILSGVLDGDGISGTLVDITERKQAEEALKRYADEISDLYHNAPCGYYSLDRDGIIIRVNDIWLRWLGYTSEEILGKKRLGDLLTPESREAFKHNFEVFKRQGWIQDLEYDVIRKDGTILPVLVNATAVVDDENNYLMSRSTLLDMTEHKKAEESIQQYVSLLAATLESTADGILVIDREGDIVSFNQKFLSMWRVPESVIAGKSSNILRDYVADQLKASEWFLENLKDLYSYPLLESFDVLEFKDGRIFERYSQPQRIGNDIVGRVWNFRDITERKRAEEALQKTYKDLQDAKDQVIQSEKLAAIGILASGAAHEILNPLNILSMSLQMMQIMKYSEDDLKKSFEVCKIQIDRIVKIVEGIWKFSRLPDRKLAERNIAEVIGNILDLIAPRIKVEDVKTEVNYDQSIPLLYLDREAMEQALLNLVSNALDAMQDRERRILRVSSEKKENKALIIISDTGTGIPPEIIGKIFDPFFTTKSPDKGTGLGLSVTYGIIKGHRGRVWAENNERGGASFFIELPIEKLEREDHD